MNMSKHDMPREMPEGEDPQEVRMQPSAEKARSALESREREVKRGAVGLSLMESMRKYGDKFKTIASSAALLATIQGCTVIGTAERAKAPNGMCKRPDGHVTIFDMAACLEEKEEAMKKEEAKRREKMEKGE